jgi:hypothetical protein
MLERFPGASTDAGAAPAARTPPDAPSVPDRDGGASVPAKADDRFARLRGSATAGLSTDAILAMTRGG